MKPRIRLTDPAFRYTPSTHTNIRATFAKARRRIAQEAEAERAQKVTQFKRREKA